jgi:tRNA-splicing endonuclease subunit Sen15, fungi type
MTPKVAPEPQPSALQNFIATETPAFGSTDHTHFHHLALQILHNLQYQHRWTQLRIHTTSPLTGKPLPRPLISGLPPNRLYVHPDEQVELLQAQAERKKKLKQKETAGSESSASPNGERLAEKDKFTEPEFEWVLPTHLREKWSLKRFAVVFDGISLVPPDGDGEDGKLPNWKVGLSPNKWRTIKRVLLATLSDDSTVVYYICHEGLVKPRQN